MIRGSTGIQRWFSVNIFSFLFKLLVRDGMLSYLLQADPPSRSLLILMTKHASHRKGMTKKNVSLLFSHPKHRLLLDTFHDDANKHIWTFNKHQCSKHINLAQFTNIVRILRRLHHRGFPPVHL